MDEATPAAGATPTIGFDGDWFDPLEEAVRGQVRAFIEQLLEEELGAAPRPRPLPARRDGEGASQRPPRAPAEHDVRACGPGGAAGTARERRW
jgi:hypothetical protein